MVTKILKLKNSKACPAKDGGFVILFAVMISSIILAIALGVENISLKEINFGTSAQDAGDAFFAADVGAECALYWDSQSPSAFGNSSQIPTPTCSGTNISSISNPGGSSWTFALWDLNSSQRSCAVVTVSRTVDLNNNPITEVTSKGYNVGNHDALCSSTNPNRVERELDVSY